MYHYIFDSSNHRFKSFEKAAKKKTQRKLKTKKKHRIKENSYFRVRINAINRLTICRKQSKHCKDVFVPWLYDRYTYICYIV